jgi:hypothetical protein
MKRPKWMDETPDAVIMSHELLKRSAKALRIEAKYYRKHKNPDAAWANETSANRLDQVAAGKTWAQAFDWPAVDENVKGWRPR